MLTRRILLPGLAALALPDAAVAAEPVRIGQATTSLSFLPVWAARAMNSFSAEDLALTWAALPGGDPTTLAALDSGDIDLAAVGSDTVLAAVAKGQPFQMVASLMSRVTLDLVVSRAFLARIGVTAASSLDARLAVLKGALIGVSAVGGTQDRAARWLAARAGLDPKTGVQVAMVGGPPALQAALENGRIDAFVLSPPEAQLAAAGGYGAALIGFGQDFPELASLPFLVMVARTPVDAAGADRITRTLRALRTASAAVVADPAKAAALIGSQFFPRVAQPVLVAAIEAMRPGLADGGRFAPAGIAALVQFASAPALPGSGEGTLWTNRYNGPG